MATVRQEKGVIETGSLEAKPSHSILLKFNLDEIFLNAISKGFIEEDEPKRALKTWTDLNKQDKNYQDNMSFFTNAINQEIKDKTNNSIKKWKKSSKNSAAVYLILNGTTEYVKNSLDAGSKNISIEITRKSRGVKAKFFDDGSGFPGLSEGQKQDYQEKLSGKATLDSNKKGKNLLGGSGIGLAQATTLLHTQGGKLEISNISPRGACLEFFSEYNKKGTNINKKFRKIQTTYSGFVENHQEQQTSFEKILEKIKTPEKMKEKTVESTSTRKILEDLKPTASGLSVLDSSSVFFTPTEKKVGKLSLTSLSVPSKLTFGVCSLEDPDSDKENGALPTGVEGVRKRFGKIRLDFHSEASRTPTKDESIEPQKTPDDPDLTPARRS